ncbi:MAG: hypothetical protein K0S99_2137, partial [Thermomicrobiales bacterium]|nr:hypothetical protein [Thermomicrobiales bacterium]
MSTRHGPKLTRRQTIPLMALAVSGGTLLRAPLARAQATPAPEIPQVTVAFGHEPYFDHTQAIIGIEQG